MEPQSQVCGQVKPDGDLLLDPRRRIARGQLLEQILGLEEVKEVALGDFVDHLHGVELAVFKRLQHEILIVLEDHEV